MSDPARDPNEAAADLLRKATQDEDSLPPDLEAAWEAWIGSIQQTDERVRTLLRAAFEAGIEVGSQSASADFARKGGKKGGRARADKLTPEQRSDIARRAAEARWKSNEGG